MAETITIGTITFVVAPEETPKPQPKKPKPKPKQQKRLSAPQCSPSRSKLGPDGYYHIGSIAARMWREKNKGRLERWGILKTWEE